MGSLATSHLGKDPLERLLVGCDSALEALGDIPAWDAEGVRGGGENGHGVCLFVHSSVDNVNQMDGQRV
jgi:hypothetical protein